MIPLFATFGLLVLALASMFVYLATVIEARELRGPLLSVPIDID